MVVPGETGHRPTPNLIAPQPQNCYITTIKPIHWQLRSIIGVSERGTVYYPSGPTNQHIQEFDPATKQSTTVAHLGFSPRCLVATKGWICCGGELGEFVAIRMNAPGAVNGHTPAAAETEEARVRVPEPEPSPSSPSREPRQSREFRQARQPWQSRPARVHGPGSHPWLLGRLIGSRNDDASDDERLFAPPRTRHRNRTALLARVRPGMTALSGKYGTERINCVTIWTPSDIVPLSGGARDFPVAVLSNNDKTVTLVNLETAEMLDEIEYPDCLNRAVISPDGSILACISDDPYLYIHQRVPCGDGEPDAAAAAAAAARSTSQSPSPGPDRAETEGCAYQWKYKIKHALPGQSPTDTTVRRGSFAACFSNTGEHLAVATQHGVICVFDVGLLMARDDDAMVACFESSQSDDDEGAVREMAFCPGPYDLLAWTEDHGAAGVADMRDLCVSRQVLRVMEQKGYNYSYVQQTLDDEPDRVGGGSPNADSPSHDRPNRPDNHDRPDNDNHNRPDDNRHDDDTDDMDDDADGTEQSRQSRAGATNQFMSEQVRDAARTSTEEPATATATGPRARNDDNLERLLTEQETREAELQARREREFEMLRRAWGPTPISIPSWAATPRPAGAGAGTNSGSNSGTGSGTNSNTNSGRQQRATMFPWIMPPMYQAPQAGQSRTERTERERPLRFTPAQRAAQRRQRERQAVAGNTYLGWSTLPPMPTLAQDTGRRGEVLPEDRPMDGFTAGMSWTDDGRVLFVGTQEGIFEFHVHTYARCFFPCLEKR